MCIVVWKHIDRCCLSACLPFQCHIILEHEKKKKKKTKRKTENDSVKCIKSHAPHSPLRIIQFTAISIQLSLLQGKKNTQPTTQSTNARKRKKRNTNTTANTTNNKEPASKNEHSDPLPSSVQYVPQIGTPALIRIIAQQHKHLPCPIGKRFHTLANPLSPRQTNPLPGQTLFYWGKRFQAYCRQTLPYLQ